MFPGRASFPGNWGRGTWNPVPKWRVQPRVRVVVTILGSLTLSYILQNEAMGGVINRRVTPVRARLQTVLRRVLTLLTPL